MAVTQNLLQAHALAVASLLYAFSSKARDTPTSAKFAANVFLNKNALLRKNVTVRNRLTFNPA